MKSMEDYIAEVYNKYDEAEKSNKVYKKVKMKYHNPLPALCGIAACLLIVFVCGNLFKNKDNNVITPNKNNIYIATKESGEKQIIYTKYLYVDDNPENRYVKLIDESDYIVIITSIDENYCDYYIEKGKVFLKTNGKLHIEDVLKGDNNIKNKIIEYYKTSGIMPIIELEKDERVNWEEWETEVFNRKIPKEEKDITYFKLVPRKYCEIEDGKQYLVFLKYDEEKDKYNIWHYAYGVMEYDPVTKMVKNIDTGEFEEFDWELINKK